MNAVQNRLPNDSEFVLGLLYDVSSGLRLPTGLDSYIFGGYPRDLLRCVQPRDMDVQVPCVAVAEKFIQRLEESGRLISVETSSTVDAPGISDLEYHCYKLVVSTPKTEQLSIDLTYSRATSLGVNSMNHCDVTVNNIRMNRFGNFSTRIKPSQIGLKISDEEWTVRCIRDCMIGKLVWMIPDRFSKSMGATEELRAEFMQKMRERLQKMQDKGFVLAEEENRYLTSFRLE